MFVPILRLIKQRLYKSPCKNCQIRHYLYFRNGVDEDFEILMAVNKHGSAVTDKISS